MHNLPTELGFMALSVVVAAVAIGVSWLFYNKKPELPGKVASSQPWLHQLLLDKYRVDEIYEAGLIRPLVVGSRDILWRFVDRILIDGTVNAVGSAATLLGALLGRLQNGDAQVYAMWMVGGLVTILAAVWVG